MLEFTADFASKDTSTRVHYSSLPLTSRVKIRVLACIIRVTREGLATRIKLPRDLYCTICDVFVVTKYYLCTVSMLHTVPLL